MDKLITKQVSDRPKKHPKCKGGDLSSPDWGIEFYCGYETSLTCEDCRYGMGRKDPEAKCNQL